MTDAIAIPTRRLLIAWRPVPRSSFGRHSKSAKFAKPGQFSIRCLRLGRWTSARSTASGLTAHREKDTEGNYPELSSFGYWGLMMCQLRSRALMFTSPDISLKEGHWVKLICGASFEDLIEVRNLSLVYSLAGVDCIDCAADAAVVAAVVEGINAAKDLLKDVEIRRPWIMISVNDDVDPHFRKAEFDSSFCPPDCPRPCESVCPALAIKFQNPSCHPELNASPLEGGVIVERCYGCGRCLSICPLGLISARTYVRTVEAVANLLMTPEVDAIEIHTGAGSYREHAELWTSKIGKVGHLEVFETLVSSLGSALPSLKLVAVSVPDLGEAMISTMAAMYASMRPFLRYLNLWQLDGRPMSGDIGGGATRAVVALASRVVLSADRPTGYLQVAGGTNAYTVASMKEKGLCRLSTSLKTESNSLTDTLAGPKHIDGFSSGEALIAGVAFGGYARKVVSRSFQQMHENYKEDDLQFMGHGRLQLEHYPSLLIDALQEAIALVDTVKYS